MSSPQQVMALPEVHHPTYTMTWDERNQTYVAYMSGNPRLCWVDTEPMAALMGLLAMTEELDDDDRCGR